MLIIFILKMNKIYQINIILLSIQKYYQIFIYINDEKKIPIYKSNFGRIINLNIKNTNNSSIFT